ncbi:hypothetical protein PG987_006629 [Apiospora arundinis]
MHASKFLVGARLSNAADLAAPTSQEKGQSTEISYEVDVDLVNAIYQMAYIGRGKSQSSPVTAQVRTSLFDSVRDGNADALESGLRQHPEATSLANSEDGFTLLHAATNAGQRYIVSLLIKLKADLEAASRTGYTPLMLATAGSRSLYNGRLDRGGGQPGWWGSEKSM